MKGYSSILTPSGRLQPCNMANAPLVGRLQPCNMANAPLVGSRLQPCNVANAPLVGRLQTCNGVPPPRTDCSRAMALPPPLSPYNIKLIFIIN